MHIDGSVEPWTDFQARVARVAHAPSVLVATHDTLCRLSPPILQDAGAHGDGHREADGLTLPEWSEVRTPSDWG